MFRRLGPEPWCCLSTGPENIHLRNKLGSFLFQQRRWKHTLLQLTPAALAHRRQESRGRKWRTKWQTALTLNFLPRWAGGGPPSQIHSFCIWFYTGGFNTPFINIKWPTGLVGLKSFKIYCQFLFGKWSVRRTLGHLVGHRVEGPPQRTQGRASSV